MPIAAKLPRRKLGTIASALFVVLLAIAATSATGAGSISLTNTLSDGQTISRTVVWRVTPSGDTPTRVDFLVDGTIRWTERYAPYVFNGDGASFDTRSLDNGSHRLEAVAYSGTTVAARSGVTVTVANGSATPLSETRTDLARAGIASASSIESPDLAAADANDGNGATRWGSAWADNQWWQVDLGSSKSIDTVVVGWEEAYASTYKILVSTDGATFTSVASESLSTFGPRATSFNAVSARYVRVLGLTRATPYGFSAWSIGVFGTSSTTPPSVTPPTIDLALGKPVETSSAELSSLGASRANDANDATRWGSAWADNQWWQVDLGSSKSIDTVAINWEDAYAKTYKIQVSQNGSVFTDTASVSLSSDGAKTTQFPPVSARYVRVLGLTRATPYGFSAWDIRVMSSASTTQAGAPVSSSAPTITGTAKTGLVLQASPGLWESAPTSFAYQWQRCDSAGQSCIDIGSAAETAYTVKTADEGSRIRVAVTATNAVGSGVAASAPTSSVTAATASVTNGSFGAKLPSALGQSTGASYYVSGSAGSDSNPGTVDRPFATIAKAWSQASAGTTIFVRGGTYGGQINLTHKTASAGNPITVRPFGTERVLLSGPSAQEYPAVYVWRTTGLRIKGFEIMNDAGDGIKVDAGWDVEIVGNDIHGNGMQGIMVGGSGSAAPTYSKNVQIWGNRIHDNGGWWSGGNPYALVGTHGIYYGNTPSNTDGIQHGTVGGVIANNLFYDQRFGYHIQVGSQNDGLVITNNTFDNASQSDTRAGNAVQIYGEKNALATKNVLVVNNIIANNANRGVYGSGPSMTSNIVRNNLTFNNPLGHIVPAYGSSTLFTVGEGNVTADPKFVDRSSKSYQLQSTSTAIGRADANYAPATDFAGRVRNGAPDLGAVEYAG